MTTGRRLVGRDTLAGIIAFWAIASLVFLAGRWYLPAEFPRRLIDQIGAVGNADGPTPDSADQLTLLRGQLEAEGAPGAAVVITGSFEVHEVLGNVEPLGDPCPGCLFEIAGSAQRARLGDPVQVGVRYWQGTTVLSVTAESAPIEQPITDLRVQLNAGGKVFFGRECALTVERSLHDVYVTAVDGESVELLELRSFVGRLECARLENSTTGDTVALVAVFSYEAAG